MIRFNNKKTKQNRKGRVGRKEKEENKCNVHPTLSKNKIIPMILLVVCFCFTLRNIYVGLSPGTASVTPNIDGTYMNMNVNVNMNMHMNCLF